MTSNTSQPECPRCEDIVNEALERRTQCARWRDYVGSKEDFVVGHPRWRDYAGEEDIVAHDAGDHDDESDPGCPRCNELYDPEPVPEQCHDSKPAWVVCELSEGHDGAHVHSGRVVWDSLMKTGRVEHEHRGITIVESTFGGVKRYQYSLTELVEAKRHIDRYLDRDRMRAEFAAKKGTEA